MANDLSGMTTKQKAMAGLVAVIFIFVLWQVVSMFRGEGGDETPVEQPKIAANGGTPNAPQPQQVTGPRPAQIPSTVTRQQQMELLRLQQDMQSKYIAGLNTLELLKLERDILAVNNEIATTKLAMINSQKQIVEKLTPPPTPESQMYGPNPPQEANQATQNPQFTQGAAAQGVEEGAGGRLAGLQPLNTGTPGGGPNNIASYTVISITEILGKWSAVVSIQNKLYNVSVGDTLPVDDSIVKHIDRVGITLEKDGNTRKFLLVPII